MVILPSRWSACSTPIVKLAHRSARAVTVGVIVALSMTLVSGNAVAAIATPISMPAGILTAASQDDADDAFDELERRLSAVPVNASAEEAARIIYPNDPTAQAEYIDLARKVDQAARDFQQQTNPNDRVLPAVLAPLIPMIGKCITGAIGSAGMADLNRLVTTGQHIAANEVIENALNGCILAAVPAPLRAIANAAKPHVVAAIAAIVIRFPKQ